MLHFLCSKAGNLIQTWLHMPHRFLFLINDWSCRLNVTKKGISCSSIERYLWDHFIQFNIHEKIFNHRRRFWWQSTRCKGAQFMVMTLTSQLSLVFILLTTIIILIFLNQHHIHSFDLYVMIVMTRWYCEKFYGSYSGRLNCKVMLSSWPPSLLFSSQFNGSLWCSFFGDFLVRCDSIS